MSKHRAGLQKEISSIFDGVSIPTDDGAPRPSDASVPKRTDYGAEKPPAPRRPPAPTPKPQQLEPAISGPKTAPAKQPKADVEKYASDKPTTVKTTSPPAWQQTLRQMKNKFFAPKPGVSTTRQKTMTILVPVLSISLIFVLVRALSTPSGKISRARTGGPTNTQSVAGSTKIDWQIPEPYPATLRDPMQFGVAMTAQPESATSELIVNGIIYSEDEPSAVVANRIVHEGDKVLGATIIKINKDSIEFEMNGKTWTLQVQW